MARMGVFGAVAVLCLVCLDAESARADLAWPEWMTVAGKAGVQDCSPTALYFLDPTHAVVAGNSYYGARDAVILYLGPSNTTGGRWYGAQIPPGIPLIRQIRFIQGKLYAACQQTDVLVSSDSGKTWTYSGLGLTDANDIYADGAGSIRALHNPMKVFARIDTMHCVAQGDGQIYVSKDGGLTWVSSGITMADSISKGAFADRCFNVFLCPNSNGTAFRSTDLGQTWQTVNTGSGPGSEFLTGASTTPYITVDPAYGYRGLARSTDDGLTWLQIYTVTTGPWLMFVWGPMGEHVALGPFDSQIWITTTGGMDDLHSGINMTDSNGMLLSQEDTLNVPLRIVSACNAFSIPIPFWADVPGLSEHISISGGQVDDFALLDSAALSLPRKHEDTIWMAYTPHHAIDTVIISIENHWNCSIWTDTRTAIVVSIPTAQIMPPTTFAGNCQTVSGAAVVKLDSCQTLVVDSVLIPTSLLSRLHVTSPLPDTMRAGQNDSLFIAFDPSDTVATIWDSVEVFAHFPGLDSALAYWDFRLAQGFTDTIFPSLTGINHFVPVKLIALPNVALFSRDSAIMLHRASYCEQLLDTTITFTNKGCTADTIVQLTLSGSGYTLPNYLLPIIVPSDSSVTIIVNFVAPDTGTFPGSLNMQAVSGESRTISIPLSGTGFPHEGILTANTDSMIVLHRASYCEHLLDTSIAFTNEGCAADTIVQFSLNGPGFAMPNYPLPIVVSPDSTVTIVVNFVGSDTGTFLGTLGVQTLSGEMKTLFFALSGTGFPHAGVLTAQNPSLDAGSLYVCQERDTFAVIQDTGCDTVCVSNVSISGPGFVISNGTGATCIAPGERDTIWLRTLADTTGGVLANNALLTITSDAVPPLAPITLSSEIEYPVPWNLTLSPPDSAGAGQTVTYKIIQHGSLPADVSSIEFQLVFDDDLLDLTGIDEPWVTKTGYYRDTLGNAHYLLHISPIPQDSILATLHLSAYQARAFETDLQLDSITLSSGSNAQEDCAASVSTSASHFSLIGKCGGSTLAGFLKSGTIAISAIIPNPAQDQTMVTIYSGEPNTCSTQLSVLDGIGRTILDKKVTIVPGLNYIPVELGSLPKGIYEVKLSREASMGHFAKE